MERQQVEQLKEWQKDHQSFQNFLHIAQTNANRIQSVSTAPPTNNPIQYVPQPHHCPPTTSKRVLHINCQDCNQIWAMTKYQKNLDE
jgi:hypothetical protein